MLMMSSLIINILLANKTFEIMKLYKKFRLIFLIQLVCFTASFGWSQTIKLKVTGNTEVGFTVDIYNGTQLLIHNTEEFKLKLANLDLSETSEINDWKASEWTGNDTSITLSKDTYLSDFDLNLYVSVTYEVVNSNVIKKSIELFQSGMPALYYTIKENFKPAKAPSKYVTFEYDNFPGGFVHEMFPSAGFVTPDNQLVGVLMDAGYKNHYTRTTRRRVNGHGGGFVGMRKLPDSELLSVATLEEREKGQHYIQQKFGELYNLDAGKEVMLKLPDNIQKVGEVQIEKKESGVITLNCQPSGRSGFEVLLPFKDQKVYTISFLSKGNSPIALKLFRIKNGKKTIELEHGIKYIDQFPIKENEWTLFKGSILVSYIEHDSVSMVIGTQSGKEAKIEIKDLKIVEHQPQREPYNRMEMGQKETKSSYIF